MNADEIVRALRWLAKKTEFIFAAENLNGAAALIESLQAQLADLAQLTHSKSEQLSECQQNNDKLQSKLADAKRRERAAVEDMKLIVDAVREEHCDETCCFACKFDCDTSITDSGAHACECPGFERDDCFEWRGPDEKGENNV